MSRCAAGKDGCCCLEMDVRAIDGMRLSSGSRGLTEWVDIHEAGPNSKLRQHRERISDAQETNYGCKEDIAAG
jgi:hypothetical protein